jgi:predicted membrane protein
MAVIGLAVSWKKSTQYLKILFCPLLASVVLFGDHSICNEL